MVMLSEEPPEKDEDDPAPELGIFPNRNTCCAAAEEREESLPWQRRG
jgi:hypothetical protein